MTRILLLLAEFLFCFFCAAPVGAESFFTRNDLSDPVDLTIFEPSAIEEGKTYPVLYLFHGKWQQPSIWDEIGLEDALNELTETGAIQPFYVVLPHDVRYMTDMYEDPFYDEFLYEDMPYMEANYPINTSAKMTALGGVSRGALWSQFFAFDKIGRFGHIGVLSPPNPFFSFPKLYRILQDHPEAPLVRIRIDIGNADNAMRIGQEFSKQLTDLFYPHSFHLGIGGHDVAFWSSMIREYLIWFSEGFEE